MTAMTLAAFAIVAFIGIATPGPTVLLALANGARFGFRTAAWGMLGAALSDIVLIGAVALGLGALLAASEFWFSVLKWIGVIYLSWLGVQLLRSTGGADLRAAMSQSATASPRAVFRRCFLVAVTNPKGYLFFSAFLPQFVTASQPQPPQYAALALIFVATDLLVMSGYALLGSQAVTRLNSAFTVWLDRVCGGTLLVLAGSLAFYRRAAN